MAISTRLLLQNLSQTTRSESVKIQTEQNMGLGLRQANLLKRLESMGASKMDSNHHRPPNRSVRLLRRLDRNRHQARTVGLKSLGRAP